MRRLLERLGGIAGRLWCMVIRPRGRGATRTEARARRELGAELVDSLVELRRRRELEAASIVDRALARSEVVAYGAVLVGRRGASLDLARVQGVPLEFGAGQEADVDLLVLGSRRRSETA